MIQGERSIFTTGDSQEYMKRTGDRSQEDIIGT